MRREEKTTVTKIITTCDFCQKTEGWRVKPCKICKRDVCTKCAVLTEDECLEEGHFFSDYPDYYCRECWDKGKNIRKLIKTTREAADDEESELLEKWHKLCRQKEVTTK